MISFFLLLNVCVQCVKAEREKITTNFCVCALFFSLSSIHFGKIQLFMPPNESVVIPLWNIEMYAFSKTCTANIDRKQVLFILLYYVDICIYMLCM